MTRSAFVSRVLTAGLALALAMSTVALAQTIRIGATVAATGAASALGEPEANTFRMLQDQLNAAGGINGVPVEIIFLDTASDTAQAVTNVNRLIQENDVHVIICCTISANSLAIIDPVQAALVPNISLAASAAIIEPVEQRRWVFKTPQTDRLMITGIVEDMVANDLTTLAYLAIDDAYGEGGLNELNAAIAGTDVEVVRIERRTGVPTPTSPRRCSTPSRANPTPCSSGASCATLRSWSRSSPTAAIRVRSTSATASATRASWSWREQQPTVCACPSAR